MNIITRTNIFYQVVLRSEDQGMNKVSSAGAVFEVLITANDKGNETEANMLKIVAQARQVSGSLQKNKQQGSGMVIQGFL